MPMDVPALAQMVNLTPEQVQKVIAPFRINVAELEWNALEVPNGQEITMDARSTQFRRQVKELQPKSLEDIREWVGIPQDVFKPPKPARLTGALARAVAAIPPAPTFTLKIPPNLLHSLSPAARMADLSTPQRELLQGASRQMVYGDVKAAQLETPLFKASLNHILAKLLPLIFFPSITVNPGATLNIASSISAVTAFRIRIFKTGRIRTPSYVKFHCYSVEGGL